MRVNSLTEAQSWFLGNSSGTVTCCSGGKEKECDSYPEAEVFFNANPPALEEDTN